MRRTASDSGSDQGAILVHVAFALLALFAFTAFVIDYGVFWESRRQAQNAADAGALAGAIALAFDDRTDFSSTGTGAQAAVSVAQSNLVWGAAPSVIPATDVQILSGTGVCPPPNVDGTCIRVDVYRTAARGNALPVFFGSLVGLTSQDIRATATAQVAAANASNCIKPIAVADKWIENNPVVGAPWSPTSTFDPTGPNPDVYIPPSATGPGSGFDAQTDYGTEMLLKPGRPRDAINPGWFQPIRFPGAQGGSDFRNELSTCTNGSFKIGDYLDKENGNMIGPTAQGVRDLVALDPNARWDTGTQKIVNSCWQTNSCVGNPSATQSPRIVALPVFDLQEYLATGGTGNGSVRIVNILGFFVEDMVGNDVRGVLVTAPGLFSSGGGSVSGPAAFLNTIMLVR